MWSTDGGSHGIRSRRPSDLERSAEEGDSPVDASGGFRTPFLRRRVGSPENAAPKGGRSHPRLNIAGRPIAQKYCEGKVKRISKGRSKALEIAEGEAYAAVARPRTVLRGRQVLACRSRSSRSGARRRGFGGARKPGGRELGGSAGETPTAVRRPSASRRFRTEGVRTGFPRRGERGGAFRAGPVEAPSALGRGCCERFREGRFGSLRVFRGAGEKAPYDPS